ncbi:ABC transporter permease [Candidatus Woesearchaeota archaeon]|nr:ABC transporter permease [Candidatus Woesearchaeota archaeon]
MIKDYVRLSFFNLKRRRLRSYLTMIGIIIGIAAVISLVGLGEGLRNFVTAQFNIVDADVITVMASGTGNGPPGTGVVNPLTQKQLDRINSVNGVDVAFGRLIQLGDYLFNDKRGFTYIASIPAGEERKIVYDIVDLKTDEGRLLKDGDTLRIMVGSSFKDNDESGKRVEVGSKLEIEGHDFTVVGVLEKKGSFAVDTTIIMNEEIMREIFSEVGDDEYDVIVAKVKDGADMKAVKQDIEKVLRKERDVEVGEEDFSVETPENAVKTLTSTLSAINIFVYIIALISVVVGGIGIMNTMYTSVVERIGDIGTMKAIGARNSDIFVLFFLESGLLGMVGGIAGIILGSGLAYGLAAIAGANLGLDISASVSPMLVILSLLFSFIIGTLAGLLPALQAAKMNPVDALSESR